MGETFFISDLHFGHKNCLAFDNRPFKDIESHDKTLIQNWNKTVGYDDDIYILGDISWYNSTETIKIFKELNGIKHLIIGNHDRKLLKNRELRNLFIEITDYKEIQLEYGKGIILSHYPIPFFNHRHHGWYHLYGHVHASADWNITERIRYEIETLYEQDCNMFNVGCMMDYMGYQPRTLEEIIDLYDRWKWSKSIDKLAEMDNKYFEDLK